MDHYSFKGTPVEDLLEFDESVKIPILLQGEDYKRLYDWWEANKHHYSFERLTTVQVKRLEDAHHAMHPDVIHHTKGNVLHKGERNG